MLGLVKFQLWYFYRQLLFSAAQQRGFVKSSSVDNIPYIPAIDNIHK